MAGKSGRKYGRNKTKCAVYRERVGKPNGPGEKGQKSHHNSGRHVEGCGVRDTSGKHTGFLDARCKCSDAGMARWRA